jgi:hypothetical protein
VDFKKHSLVIALGAVVSVSVITYVLVVPATSEGAEALRQQCEAKASNIEKIAAQSGQPDGLKTQKHLDLATKHEKELGSQTADALKTLQTLTRLDTEFKTYKMNSKIGFDIWMGDFRTQLNKKASDANLQLPHDVECKFSDPTNEKSADESQTQAYRTRHLAIIEEVVTILATKPIKENIEQFDAVATRDNKPLPIKLQELGAIALEKITLSKPRLPSDKTPAQQEVSVRSMRGALPSTLPKMADLPYTISSIDIVFTAPASSIPFYFKALETSTRWMGNITRFDFQRTTLPFPSPTDAKIVTAGPTPETNTYYREGPVRVLVTLDFYEFDKARESEFNKTLTTLK